MASTLQHLTIAIKINDKYLKYSDEKLSEYLLGSVVCDASKLKTNKPLNETKKEKTPETIE